MTESYILVHRITKVPGDLPMTVLALSRRLLEGFLQIDF